MAGENSNPGAFHTAPSSRAQREQHLSMLERQYRQLDDEELGSAQRHLASSEQALHAARAGCDVRAERWTTNSRVVGHTLYDRPSPSPRRSSPRSLTRDAINSRRTPPIGAHPIHDLTQSQKGTCFSAKRHREFAQLLSQAAPPASPSRRGSSPSWRGSSPSRPPPVMVPYTPVSSCSADVPLLPPSRREAHFYPAAATAPSSGPSNSHAYSRAHRQTRRRDAATRLERGARCGARARRGARPRGGGGRALRTCGTRGGAAGRGGDHGGGGGGGGVLPKSALR
jgi:hypothetical protein